MPVRARRAERWRARAEGFRVLADCFTDPACRAQLRRLAEGYDRMASGVLSCPARVSIRTVRRHCLANGRVCPTAAVWGDQTGETMAKLLNELGRGKPAIPPSFTPCPLALADRDRREALRDQQSLTAAFFGDPLPGMSALDRREREPSLTRVVSALTGRNPAH